MKLCHCKDCIFWDPTDDLGSGYCAFNPPTVHVLGDHLCTTMPVTSGHNFCGDGWDGASPVDKLAEGILGEHTGSLN